MTDPQDIAEQFDEDLLGADPLSGTAAVTSDEARIDVPPDRPVAIPFADADVTDESIADRAAREEPEVWEQALDLDEDDDVTEELDGRPAEVVFDQFIDQPGPSAAD